MVIGYKKMNYTHNQILESKNKPRSKFKYTKSLYQEN